MLRQACHQIHTGLDTEPRKHALDAGDKAVQNLLRSIHTRGASIGCPQSLDQGSSSHLCTITRSDRLLQGRVWGALTAPSEPLRMRQHPSLGQRRSLTDTPTGSMQNRKPPAAVSTYLA